jgi:hypothetical protein
MAWLRAKLCVFILFGLISFGQAYPYSYAWAESQHAECGCNDSGRKCIHGCDLKKRPKPVDHSAHGGHDHAAMGHAAMGHAVVDQPADDSRPLWVSPDCSKQKKREILDFRGDPFVPQTVVFFLPIHSLMMDVAIQQRPFQRSILPDPPPPKA